MNQRVRSSAQEAMALRWLDRASRVVALFAVLLIVLAALLWALGHPLFAIRSITLQGQVEHNSAAAVRALVLPQLKGNLFSLDLQEARTAFEGLPWVRTAEVHRVFPNQLNVVLQEHQGVAYWDQEGEVRMVNAQGQVFEAVGDSGGNAQLPVFSGPAGQSADMLQMYAQLRPRAQRLNMDIEALSLSSRGSWRVQLDQGAQVELGRGDGAVIVGRMEFLVRTLTQVASRYQRSAANLVSADMRHAGGYALRLQGVTSVAMGSAAADTKRGG